MNLLCVSAILRENPSLHLSLAPVLHETVRMPALGLPLCHPCCQTGKEEGKRLVQALFHGFYNLSDKTFFSFPGFQIGVFLCAIISVKIIDQCKGDHMAVGFEFLLVHGLQIFPCFPLQVFLQIEA